MATTTMVTLVITAWMIHELVLPKCKGEEGRHISR
jgi:hypothetical protein